MEEIRVEGIGIRKSRLGQFAQIFDKRRDIDARYHVAHGYGLIFARFGIARITRNARARGDIGIARAIDCALREDSEPTRLILGNYCLLYTSRCV